MCLAKTESLLNKCFSFNDTCVLSDGVNHVRFTFAFSVNKTFAYQVSLSIQQQWLDGEVIWKVLGYFCAPEISLSRDYSLFSSTEWKTLMEYCFYCFCIWCSGVYHFYIHIAWKNRKLLICTQLSQVLSSLLVFFSCDCERRPVILSLPSTKVHLWTKMKLMC